MRPSTRSTSHRQHRAGPRRTDRHDQQGNAVGGGEGAQVPGRVRRRVLFVAEHQRGHGQHHDQQRDDRQQHPHDAPPAGPVGQRGELPDPR